MTKAPKHLAIALSSTILAWTHSVSHAADYPVIDVTTGTSTTLLPGDTVNYSGGDAAVTVTGTNAVFNATDVDINATASATTQAPKGVLAQSGGKATLSGGSVQSNSSRQNTHVLDAIGANSEIIATGTTLTTNSAYGSYAAEASGGGKITLSNVTTNNINQGLGLHATGLGSSITATNSSINNAAVSVTAESGGQISLISSTVLLDRSGSGTAMIMSRGVGSSVLIEDSTITMTGGWSSHAIESNAGGHTDVIKSTVTANGTGVHLHAPSGMNGSTATIRDSTFTLTGANSYGINVNGAYASAIVENSQFDTTQGRSVWLADANTSLTANNFTFNSYSVGIDSRGGGVTLTNGSISTQANNAHALYMSVEKAGTRLIDATNVNIVTNGNSAVGALSRVSGARIQLKDSTVTTNGASSYGLYATGNNAALSASNTQVKTLGAGASSAIISNQASMTLNQTSLTTSGASAAGVWSYWTVSNPTAFNQLSVNNGSSIDTTDGVAILATGGNHQFSLSGTQITSRTNGDINTGVFLQSQPAVVTSGGTTTNINTGTITVTAAQSTIIGDVIMRSGTADIALSNQTSLVGAIQEIDQGQVSRLALDATSAWKIRGDSSLQRLENQGLIQFMAPTLNNFKTLHAHEYIGGGKLVMNTRLGGDNSSTDKFIIDGGPVSGKTSVQINDAGGAGGQTETGILIIETLNGATTTNDNFVLDQSSSGYRSSTATIAGSNGYDYSLLRSGNGGTENDWYLVSKHVERPVEPPPTPTPEPTPPAPPPGSGKHNISPEGGAYAGLTLSSRRLFSLQLRDRTPFETQSSAHSRNIWARVQAGHERDLSMPDSQMNINGNYMVFQIGGDLWQQKLSENGNLRVGLMGGYGEARNDAKSTFYLPTQQRKQNVTSDAKATGYAIGLYATAFENASTQLGFYGDTWVQYARFNNTLTSELGSTSFDANLWSASVETGYSVRPFTSYPSLQGLVVTPNAQVIYTNYSPEKAVLKNLQMSPDANSAWQTRLGVRIAHIPTGSFEAGSAIRPFMEINWLYNSTAAVRIGNNTLNTTLSRNVGQLKLGVDGQINKSWQISANVYGQVGSEGEYGFGGMLNARYTW